MDAERYRLVDDHCGLSELVLSDDVLTSGGQSSGIRSRILRYGPLVLWVGLIFFFSSGEASASQTSRFIRPILEFLFPSASEATLLQYHFFIRKCAHFTEYAVLAFWTVRALARSSISSLRTRRFLLSVALTLAIALIDEFIQSFEPSRTSSIADVGLDLLGGAVMTIALKLIDVRRSPKRGPRD